MKFPRTRIRVGESPGFLRKWSKAVLAGLLGLGLIEEAAQETDAAWVNRYGGGGLGQ